MKIIICVHLTQWPIDRLRRRLPPGHPEAMVIVRTVADRQIIMALSSEAAAMGVRAGMTLTQAHALQAHICHAAHDPPRDARALEALGRWLMRFSPTVSIATENRGSAGPLAHQRKGKLALPALPPTHGIFIDATGGERLFGGIDALVKKISQAISALGIHARCSAAPTPAAAWALAWSGVEKAVAWEELQSTLAPLPPTALQLSDDLAALLYHLGLSTIGQVMRMPRETLPARFGMELTRRLDQATGSLSEPLIPLEYRPPIEAGIEFDGVIPSLELLWPAFEELLARLIAQLVRWGRGARQIEVTISRSSALPVRRTIRFSRPSRNPAELLRLVRCALEEPEDRRGPSKRLRPSPCRAAPAVGASLGRHEHRVQNAVCDDGFIGLHLSIPLHEHISPEQIELLEHEQHASREQFDRLIDHLRVRLGEETIIQAKQVESYLPEKAWRSVTDFSDSASPPARGGAVAAYPAVRSGGARPLRLLARPAEIRVMVSPSHDREGRPVTFTHCGQVHRAVQVVGPERIAGQWWDGYERGRDYFDVEDPTGRRFWLFRVRQTGRWFLHGFFE